ncbi:MAG TPA: MFS transporter, partial [Streptosporangiaceae bacterium]|nr:MFS transporter [Streptosporangiaceae bacterium]
MSFRTLRHPEAAPASPPAPEQVKESQSARHTWLLIVCCVAQFMVILDLTIVNVALPSIQDNLGFSSVNLQWVVDAYAIVFAGFLMLGGRVSDRFGRRESLVAALTLFALASLAGGAALDQQMLVAARAVQGLSGALMAAASLAAITAAFPPGPARHRAIGLWGAMNGAGGAAGALFGGVITQELGWRWVLLINPPIGIAAAVVAYFVIVDHGQKDTGKKFDIAGALTLTIGQVILAYGFVNGGNYGWLSFRADGPIVLGLVILVLFTVIEARWASAPLVPFKQITKTLKVANGIVLAFSAALFPMWYVSSLYLQQVLGLSPLEAGLAFFPMALVIFLVAQRAGKLVGRFGVRTVLASGLIMMASGMLLLARIGPSGSAIGFVVFPGLLVAAGIGMSIVPSTIVATQGAGPAQAGLASGLVNTSRQVGGAVGIALLISLATTYTSGLIGENKPLNPSLTDGFRLAYFIQVALVLTAAVMALTLVPRHSPAPQAHAAPAPAPAAPPEPEQVSPSEQVPPAPAGAPPAKPRARLRFPVLPTTIAAVIVVFFAADYIFCGAPGAPIGAYSLQNSYSFVTAPNLHPPMIVADEPTVNSQLEPGYILVADFYDLSAGKLEGQSGPLILNNKLQPVWFKPVPTSQV